jgi:hypothetical protein
MEAHLRIDLILACLLKNGGNLGGEGGPSSYIDLILACLLNMGEIEEGRDAHLPILS